MSDLPEGMDGLRSSLMDCIQTSSALAAGDSADALLAPDGPLFPALRALGDLACKILSYSASPDEVRETLALHGVAGPLADACLAAAEAP